MKKTFYALFMAALVLPLWGLTTSTAKAATINTAIRSKSQPTVYWYAADGKRYAFPNPATYFTWFPSFANVRFVSDQELAVIQMGGNVTYRPGARLVKTATSPKVYAVSRGGVLRHVVSESIAKQLYGQYWAAKIHVLPGYLFSDYAVGSAITSASDYSVSQEYNGVKYPHQSLRGVSSFIQNDSRNRITHMTLVADNTLINSGSPLRLTANAFNVGNWNYSGNRIEIRDARNGTIVRTCFNQSWCVAQNVLSSGPAGSTVQYETRIYDRNGRLVMSRTSPVITFMTSGATGSGTTSNTDTVSSGLTANATLSYASNSIFRTNNTVYANLNVQNTNSNVNDLIVRIYDERSQWPIVTCSGRTNCQGVISTGATPISTRLYGVITSTSVSGRAETQRLQLTTTN